MNEKQCPLMMIAQQLSQAQRITFPDRLCIEGHCAFWNEYLACCGLIAPGLIQGAEIARREMLEDLDNVYDPQ